jgi:hypothetical protein
MSHEISNVTAAPPVAPVARPSRPAAASPAATSTSDDAVRVDTTPSVPPPEVMDQIASASAAYDRLTATGHQLHFAVDQNTRAVSIELHDTQGNVLGTLSPSQVLDVAAGASVP